MRAHKWTYHEKSLLAGWFVNFKQFSLVARGGCGTDRRVCTVFVNLWTANGEKRDEERYGQFWELSGQGEASLF